MRLSEFYLEKLAEECDEVGQRVSKWLCFGPNEVQENEHQNPLKLNNRQRLQNEVNDVIAMAIINGLMPRFEDLPNIVNAKRAKLDKYLILSRKCGRIDPEPEDRTLTVNAGDELAFTVTARSP